MNSINKTARIAGFLYFMYIVTSVIANMFGRFVFVDAPVTVNHITAHESLFRIGLVISLFSYVLFLLAAWALYVLLEPVDNNMALLFLLLNLGGFAILVLSHLNLFSSLLLLSGADYLKVFQPDQLQVQAILFVNSYKNGSTIAQIPYGIWLFPLGYLVFKSNFLPKILGILLIADGFGLLIYVCQRFIWPSYEIISYPCLVVSFIAEISLSLWLLIKGVEDQNKITTVSKKEGDKKMIQLKEIWRKVFVLAIVGGLGFWVANFAISLTPIAAEYRAAFSISYLPMALVEALVGGLIIGCCVSYFLLRFFEKIPTKNPILKALILSFGAMVIIEILSTLVNPNNASVYLLIDTGMNVPRFLALGIVVGHLYDKLNGGA